MAQYFLPHISYSVINTWLEDIVQEILIRLKNNYFAHRIFSISLEQLSFWRDNNTDYLNLGFWKSTEAKQIIRILERYIFFDLEISKLYQLLKVSDPEAKYFNFVSYFRLH